MVEIRTEIQARAIKEIFDSLPRENAIINIFSRTSESVNKTFIQVIRPFISKNRLLGLIKHNEKLSIDEIIVEKDELAFERTKNKLQRLAKHLE